MVLDAMQAREIALNFSNRTLNTIIKLDKVADREKTCVKLIEQ